MSDPEIPRTVEELKAVLEESHAPPEIGELIDLLSNEGRLRSPVHPSWPNNLDMTQVSISSTQILILLVERG